MKIVQCGMQQRVYKKVSSVVLVVGIKIKGTKCINNALLKSSVEILTWRQFSFKIEFITLSIGFGSLFTSLSIDRKLVRLRSQCIFREFLISYRRPSPMRRFTVYSQYFGQCIDSIMVSMYLILMMIIWSIIAINWNNVMIISIPEQTVRLVTEYTELIKFWQMDLEYLMLKQFGGKLN